MSMDRSINLDIRETFATQEQRFTDRFLPKDTNVPWIANWMPRISSAMDYCHGALVTNLWMDGVSAESLRSVRPGTRAGLTASHCYFYTSFSKLNQ